MPHTINHLNQPIGLPVENWQSPPVPPRTPLPGKHCRLEPLDPERHAADLYAACTLDTTGRNWTYLPYGPFESFESYYDWTTAASVGSDPLFFAIIDARTEKAVGVASYMRIDPKNGCIEVGGIHYSPLLQKTIAGTEAMFLMMRQAFALGYRRYEWKCDSLNAPSRAAAQRFGFSFEGIFRQAVMYKGRNRDTAWYAIIDSEWPELEKAFEKWLHPANFDAAGTPLTRLSDWTAPLLKNLE